MTRFIGTSQVNPTTSSSLAYFVLKTCKRAFSDVLCVGSNGSKENWKARVREKGFVYRMSIKYSFQVETCPSSAFCCRVAGLTASWGLGCCWGCLPFPSLSRVVSANLQTIGELQPWNLGFEIWESGLMSWMSWMSWKNWRKLEHSLDQYVKDNRDFMRTQI